MEKTGLLPINLNICDRPVLVVGGGAVATRKCNFCLTAGGKVTVIAPLLSPTLSRLAEAGQIIWRGRTFRSGDTSGFLLVFAATNDPAVNQAVAADTRKHGGLVDLVGAPAEGDFISPAVLTRGRLQIAVSTGGAAPGVAQRIRDEIGEQYGNEHALALEMLATVRQKLLTDPGNKAYNNRIFEQLAASDLPRLCRDGDYAAIDRLLEEIAGSGYSLADLGLSVKGPT